jgi:2-(1,2-epoxy-1,2-dihydrophenyl)acetyl-CoA isomerase
VAELEVTRDGGVLTLTLNRPEALNAFNLALHGELAAGLEEARDPDVRAVVITGAGRGFCAGQDLREFGERPDADTGDMLRATYHPNVLAIRALEKPVIAAVNGPCAGAGVSLACACDLRIAAESAVFIPGFVGIGLVPDAGGSFFAVRLLGQARAFEWMTSNRRLTAEEALDWGLVSAVVPDAELAGRTAELAANYAAAPTGAIAMTKRLFAQAQLGTLEEQLELEAELQTVATRSRDFAEGVAAFREKRPPRFTGR